MANKFWVGTTSNWDATAGGKWSGTSGGGGGSTVPTTADVVFFDAASGGGTVTLTTTGNCLDLSFAGFTGTLAGSSGLLIHGNLTLGTAMVMTASSGAITLGGTSGSATITSNGKTIDRPMTVNAGTATKTLADALVLGTTRTLTITNGTFDANDKNVTVSAMSSASGTRTITMGSGTWELRGTGAVWNINVFVGTPTLNAETSTIKVTDNSANFKSFSGGSLIYNNFWYAPGTGSGTLVIGDEGNTFNDFKDDGTVAHQISWFGITTVTTFSVSGNSGQLITLTPFDADWTISSASGTINCDYLSIDHSIATGGATWNAGANSIDNGNNSGWIFGEVGQQPRGFGIIIF